ncbi:MAG TPA: HD domain-containing protein [Patescibacteria group bacterium]|nr:HD domain-containing protein [Patescibacteria group bacterium]
MALYEAKDPKRADWADWLWQNHVWLVAQYARQLAEQHGANGELAEASAWLHDIADTCMSRFDDTHEAVTLRIARDLLAESGYAEADIAVIVDDAILLHGCHEGRRPASMEGQILATADALAHLKTDFYVYAAWALGHEGKDLASVKAYVLQKSARDFTQKICFDMIRTATRPDYDLIQQLFSR